MSDMDVWKQIEQHAAQFHAAHPNRLSKITASEPVLTWLVHANRSIDPGAFPDLTLLRFLGVPIEMDREFWEGQIRLHSGEQFRDYFMILPPTYPRFEPKQLSVSMQYEFDASVRVYMARPSSAPWNSLGIVQGVTMRPTGT